MVALWEAYETSEGGNSGVTKIEDWPTWLQWAVAIPNAVILLTLWGWTPKTKKGWYIAVSLPRHRSHFFHLFSKLEFKVAHNQNFGRLDWTLER